MVVGRFAGLIGDTELGGTGSQAAAAASPKVPTQAANNPRRESELAARRACAGDVEKSLVICTPDARTSGPRSVGFTYPLGVSADPTKVACIRRVLSRRQLTYRSA